MSEPTHIWQWAGYHFTMNQGQGYLHWRCQFCGKHKEEQVVMTEEFYQTAYRIWEYEQHHKGIFDKQEEGER